MDFIDDHKFQPSKEVLPKGVVGKNSRMQHIRIGQQTSRRLPNNLSFLRGCVSVIYTYWNGLWFKTIHEAGQLDQLLLLVMCQRFCRENKQGSGRMYFD